MQYAKDVEDGWDAEDRDWSEAGWRDNRASGWDCEGIY